MSIDRDFGRGDAWPDFVSVEVIDPVLMIVVATSTGRGDTRLARVWCRWNSRDDDNDGRGRLETRKTTTTTTTWTTSSEDDLIAGGPSG